MDVTYDDSLESDDCGWYHKEQEVPIIMAGTFLGMAAGIGDFFQCKAHAESWAAERIPWTESLPLEEYAEEGFEIIRFVFTCTHEWNDDNPVYAVGAMLFAGDDFDE